MKYLFLLLLSQSVHSQTMTRAGEQDHYRNFSELAADNIEGKDYSVIEKDNPSNFLVMSFHGGSIEPGTTELGLEVSGVEIDFYSFVGIKNKEEHAPSFTASDLHLTSARFNEPRLLKMIRKASLCLALHGFGGVEADFCVGGGNPQKRAELVGILKKDFPELKSCELCCPPFNGTSLKNPVNLCEFKGVQVEMSPKVRQRILTDSAFKKNLGSSMRGVFFP